MTMTTNITDRDTIINTVKKYADARKALLAAINEWAAHADDLELERTGVRECATIVGRLEVEAIEEAEGDAEVFIKATAAMKDLGLQTSNMLLKLAETVLNGGLYKNNGIN